MLPRISLIILSTFGEYSYIAIASISSRRLPFRTVVTVAGYDYIFFLADLRNDGTQRKCLRNYAIRGRRSAREIGQGTVKAKQNLLHIPSFLENIVHDYTKKKIIRL